MRSELKSWVAASDKSEIRQSQIIDLRRRVSDRTYRKYLYRINIKRLRGLKDADVKLEFPVTAIIGPNGSGKSTILGAAALLSRDVKPRQFFARSGKYDQGMIGWFVQYYLVDGDAKAEITRSAGYPKAKWSRTTVDDREVHVFGVQRTVPANERKEFVEFQGGSFKGDRLEKFSDEVIAQVEKILGKPASEYLKILKASGKSTGGVSESAKSLLAGETADHESYSEFHFGAGEASVLRIISRIEQSANESLILIEEIENGLHPVAVSRLVEYLLDVARRKSCQVIFTTHSNDALRFLPEDAVWSCIDGRVRQGKLDVRSLRVLTGEIRPRMTIFVEDDVALTMAVSALRSYCLRHGIPIEGFEVHSVGGEGNVRDFTASHNEDPSVPFSAMGILDGDMTSTLPAKSADIGLVTFPAPDSPESLLQQRVLAVLDRVAPRIATACELPLSEQTHVKMAIKSAITTVRDQHLFFDEVGNELNFISGETVRRAFVTQWIENYPQEVDAIFDPIAQRHPEIFIPTN